MKTIITLALAALVAVICYDSADARHVKRHHSRPVVTDKIDANGNLAAVATTDLSARRYRRSHRWSRQFTNQVFARYADGNVEYDSGRVVGHPSGCPGRAFCGCGVSVRVFGHPVKSLYLASNWRRFPPASPGAGMVAWRHGHAMYIERLDSNGNAVVYDPNSGGHQTRVHTRSLAGYRIVNPHGGRVAQL